MEIVFLLPNWKDRGIMVIHNIFDNHEKLFQNKFSIRTNFLKYDSIIFFHWFPGDRKQCA